MRYSVHLTVMALFSAVLVGGCSEDPAAPEAGARAVVREAGPEPDDISAEVLGARGIPFAETHVFFEFNSTDNDLGFQLMLDGDEWRRVNVFDPDDSRILDFKAKGPLQELGLTELRFESAEPSPGEVLALFAPGEYSFVGVSVDGERLEGSGMLSHDLPPAPVFVSPPAGGTVAAEDLVIRWIPSGGLAGYEVILVNEDTGASMTVELDGGATSLEVPAEFAAEDTEYKAEILSVAVNGNKTITEITFFTE